MKATSLVALAALALASCGAPDCPAKGGYNSCGYCREDRVTSSNPHAGMCTYCSGACGADPCNPACGGGTGGGSCAAYNIPCGQTSNGAQVVGGPWPQSCGSCPSGTYQGGEDRVTSGGPYWICICNGH